jgi:hypothetical protein
VTRLNFHPEFFFDFPGQLGRADGLVARLALVQPLADARMDLLGVSIAPIAQGFPTTAARLVLGLRLGQLWLGQLAADRCVRLSQGLTGRDPLE